MMRRVLPPPARLLALLLLGGCIPSAPQRLDLDQMGYASALSEGLKRQMLLNIVRLRHADVPSFLAVSQVISGYTLQSTGQVGLNAYPNANPGNYATLSGTLEYTTRPTFTFTPVTGERFARSYLRPLAPAELLSLAQSGVPVELLFRVGVQSVNGLANRASSSTGSQPSSGGFEALLAALRELQASGAVSLRFDRQMGASQAHLMLEGEDGPAVAAIRRLQELLGLNPALRDLEVVYGRHPARRGQLAVLTRSILQILYELGAQIEVSPEDAARGETGAAVAAGAPRPLLLVHQGGREPSDAYAAIQYRGRWFWIEAGDYRSKAIFTFVHVLQVLAESSHAQPTPMVTIPAQ